jgi:ABC-type multidrug transport system permease subunit
MYIGIAISVGLLFSISYKKMFPKLFFASIIYALIIMILQLTFGFITKGIFIGMLIFLAFVYVLSWRNYDDEH